MVANLVKRYAIDGIHLDDLRFPATDFDYSRGALEAFRAHVREGVSAAELAKLDAVMAIDPFAYPELRAEEWRLFRQTRLTALVTRLRSTARAIRPDVFVSASVDSDVVTAAAGIGPETLLTRNRIFVDRTRNVGIISRADAIDYGLTGPNLRGSGVDYDVRKASPYLVYGELDFEVPVGSVGDSYDRYLVRMEEMRQSVRIIRQCLAKLPGGFDNDAKEPISVPDGKITLPPKTKVLTSMEELIHQFMLVTQGINAPAGEVYFGAENPKGELGFYINSRGGGTPYRLKIRAPSFCNLSILPHVLPGHLMSDVVSILGSIDFVMGECDR